MPDTKQSPANEAAAQNQEAANSASPLGAAVGSQLSESSAVNQGASAAGASPTLTVTNGVSSEHLENQKIVADVTAAIAATPHTDTNPEEELILVLTAWKQAIETRWSHFLTGMANTPSEAKRLTEELIEKLTNHVTQVKASTTETPSK